MGRITDISFAHGMKIENCVVLVDMLVPAETLVSSICSYRVFQGMRVIFLGAVSVDGVCSLLTAVVLTTLVLRKI